MSPFGIALRIAALLAFVVAATSASHVARDGLDLNIVPTNEQAVHRMIMLGTLACITLLALPFVPGAEIGFAMPAAFGAAIAALVYGAAVVAMMQSYSVGRLLPVSRLQRLLSFLRMRRAANLVARAALLSSEARLAMLLDAAPPRVVALALRHRYVALALSVNVSGNAVIGGGGGILLMAGLSGIYATLPTFLAVAIAVSPVPPAVLFLGF